MKQKANQIPDLAIFLPDLRFGDAECVMIYLANNLSKKGYSIDIVVGEEDGQYKNLISEEIQIINLNTNKKIKMALRLSNYLKK